jgi:hypothetical protein
MTTATSHARLNDQLRGSIQARAAEAANSNSVVDAVICALIEADIDQWNVSLDDWKGILFEAFQAAKDSREGRLAA